MARRASEHVYGKVHGSAVPQLFVGVNNLFQAADCNTDELEHRLAICSHAEAIDCIKRLCGPGFPALN